LAAPVIVIIIIIIPVTHPLVVLTVSHIVPLIQALKNLPLTESPRPHTEGLWRLLLSLLSLPRRPIRRAARSRDRLFPHRFAVRRSQQRRVPHEPSEHRGPHQVIPPAKTSTGFERDFSSAISGFRSRLAVKSSAA
jgi:hypothetical protein